ncbi:MAG: FAD-dependent oxidoreductase, partial [Dehalococcoidia bacterium]
VTMGNGGKTLADLKSEGYQAVFVATGTHLPRPLTFGREKVEGTDLEGVMFGLSLLQEVNQGLVSPDRFQGKRVIVIGGGNVAFDAARTARRLGGDVRLVCLESKDKSSKDGIPADTEEIEGATEEGISITYSRGVREIVSENGKFKAIKSPRCTSVFDENGFNPQFDESDEMYMEGDVLLVTIGQAPERDFFQQEELLNERGRLDVDQTTLMSNRKEGVFIGGDVRRVGFAADAMQEGATAAESIDRYIRGVALNSDREKEYEKADIPQCLQYKPQPELTLAPAEERMNFQPFEELLTLEEAIKEARRCLDCGPCESCKACVKLELQSELPQVTVNEDLCSGCGVCVAVCRYDAPRLEHSGEALKAIIDDIKCKRCGLCVSACPSGAINTTDGLTEFIDTLTSSEAALIAQSTA